LEIGSFHQRLSEGTKASIKELYTFTDQSVPYRTFKHRIIRLAEFASFQLYSTRFEPEWMAFSPYLELPPELADPDADKDNISSESGEAISVSSANSSGLSSSSGLVMLTHPTPAATTVAPPPPPHEDIERPSVPPPLPPIDLLQSAGQKTAPLESKCEKQSSSVNQTAEVTEVAAFSPRSKACIYASGAALVGYIVYNYWHLILTCLLCLLVYEVWDKFGHKLSKKAKQGKSD